MSVCAQPNPDDPISISTEGLKTLISQFERHVDEYMEMLEQLFPMWHEWREGKTHVGRWEAKHWHDMVLDSVTNFEQYWKRVGSNPSTLRPEMEAIQSRLIRHDLANLCQDMAHTFTYSRMKEGHAEDPAKIPEVCQTLELGPYSYWTLKGFHSDQELLLKYM